jgi:hypothetical protein
MTEKMKYKINSNELELNDGIFDETTSLVGNEKGKLEQSSGNFIGTEWEEEEDILITAADFPNNGNFGGSWRRYTQSNIAILAASNASKDGNRYTYLIHRSPNISSASTWGGVSLFPPSALQRRAGDKFRLSFDYRGYSGGHTMDVYQNYSVGWGDYGIGLPTPWNTPRIASFDTDWEWKHYEKEFVVQEELLNTVGGHYDWNAESSYPSSGYYGVRYNGHIYRHKTGDPAPTIGVTPDQEQMGNGSPYYAVFLNSTAPGHFNVYENIKIGFTYQAQNARGTHVYIDNITLTNITTNEKFTYDLTNEAWVSENLTESGMDLFAKGTAYARIPRSDTSTDVFAVEGNRYVEVNGINLNAAAGRGLALTVFNAFGVVTLNEVYDTHGSGAKITELGVTLSNLTSGDYWVLTSFDAIGTESTHDNAPSLRSLLASMGSRLWNKKDPLYLWSLAGTETRNTYTAVGKGQNLIKEDGINGQDPTYKRKAVIQTRIS